VTQPPQFDVAPQLDIALDAQGFLCDYRSWTPDIASALAAQEGIRLTEAHWELLGCLREFYATYEVAPAMRPLVKYVANRLGSDKGNSLYLLALFPGSPAKIGAKLAGLPKPENCL
jgi:tRNA 2-thiouridine synthesizing protein E